jgi:replicative DNA helicase
MADLSSKIVEQKILALLFLSPLHIRAIDLDLELFAEQAHRKLAQLIKQYVKKFKSPPSKDTLKDFSESKIKKGNADDIIDALELLDTLPSVESTDVTYYFSEAENYKIGRSLFDLREELGESLEEHKVDFKKLKQTTMKKIITMDADSELIDRGFIYDLGKIKRRTKEYIKNEKGENTNTILYGIKALDNVLGGTAKGFLSLFYSGTGGGKSILGVNIAYNAAKEGYKVMYVSFEMAFDYVATRFDSRIGKLDSKEILFGKLSKENKRVYQKTLQTQLKTDLNIWLTDIPQGANTSTVLNEYEIYKSVNGTYPDLAIIDYANIMEPIKSYNGRSEKLDFLFQELHELHRVTKIAGVTMLQESRDSTKAMKKAERKQDNTLEEEGVHNIGLSNFAATHCEAVCRIKQNIKDKIQKQVRVAVNKSRYGASGEEVVLQCYWKSSYIGDKRILRTDPGFSNL